MLTLRQFRERFHQRGDDLAIEVALSLVFAAIGLVSLAALVTGIVMEAAG